MQKKRTYYEIIKVFAFTARLSNHDKKFIISVYESFKRNFHNKNVKKIFTKFHFFLLKRNLKKHIDKIGIICKFYI